MARNIGIRPLERVSGLNFLTLLEPVPPATFGIGDANFGGGFHKLRSKKLELIEGFVSNASLWTGMYTALVIFIGIAPNKFKSLFHDFVLSAKHV